MLSHEKHNQTAHKWGDDKSTGKKTPDQEKTVDLYKGTDAFGDGQQIFEKEPESGQRQRATARDRTAQTNSKRRTEAREVPPGLVGPKH